MGDLFAYKTQWSSHYSSCPVQLTNLIYLLIDFSCSLSHFCGGYGVDRDHRARDYYSPSRSRSISRSVSPRDDKASNRKSSSPKRNGRGPFDKRQRGSDRRSPSVRDNDLSPCGDNYSPYNKRDPELEHKSPSAREDDQNLSKSLSRSHYRSRSHSPSYRYCYFYFHDLEESEYFSSIMSLRNKIL